MEQKEQNSSTSERTLDAEDSAPVTTEKQIEQKSERDLEAAKPSPPDAKAEHNDPDLVTWDGPQDAENPKNWTDKEKWVLTVLVSIFTFVSPVASSMVAPALGTLGRELHMKSQIEVEMALSIFVLGYAVGPVFFGPVSEIFGRSRVLQASNVFFWAWNLGCGFAQNSAEMFVFRFLSGIGGSAPLAIGGGTIGDVWPPEKRGKAVGIYSLAPLLGPVLGPIAGGWCAEKTTWRWIFWSSSIFAGVIQVIGLIWLRETHAPTLLRRKRARLVKKTGNEKLHTAEPAKSLLSTMSGALVRPSRMLATQPIVQVIALYMAYLFGLTYLITVTFPVVWSEVYGESLGIGGLNFISLGLGTVLGVQINTLFVDRIYRRLKAKNNGVGLPEYRVLSMIIGSVLEPIGLFWYGWSVEGHVHWIMPNIGIAIFGMGVIMCLQGMQGYIIDSYTRFAASALAAVVILRSLCGFGFPLFAPYLYQRVGYGWGSSILAFISIAIGIPSPFVFWFYGAKLRAVSKFAAG
ncbi:MAG: hypothetical protein Q9165_003046 [Trypethelium subeluteriae]